MDRRRCHSRSNSRRIDIKISQANDGSDYFIHTTTPNKDQVHMKRLRHENSYLHDESQYLRKRVENLEEMVNHTSPASKLNYSSGWSKDEQNRNKRERSTEQVHIHNGKHTQKLKDTINTLEIQIEDLRIDNRQLRMERAEQNEKYRQEIRQMDKSNKFQVPSINKIGDNGKDGERLLLHNFLLSVEVKRLHKLLRRMAAHCEEVENKHSNVKKYDQQLSQGMYSPSKSANLRDLENDLMDLRQTVNLLQNKLELKDRYLSEQKKLLEEMTITQQTITRNFEKSHKNKLDDLYDKINMLRADKNDLIRDFQDMVVNKDREIERIKTDYENFKTAHCKH